MPLDRSYTDVEKEIIRRLSVKPELASLYDTVRKDENNPSLLHAVAEFVMHEYQCASGTNIAQPFEGMLTISDIRCMRQDFEEGLNMSQQMAERLLLFRLVEVYERQIDEYKAETLCFKLNTCAITETDDRHFAKVEKEFEEIFDFDEMEDIFTKKYLVFPNYMDLYGYITLIINPGAAIKKKNGENSPNNCIMVHLGNQDEMFRYLNRVGPRLDKLLNLFLELHAEKNGYVEVDKTRIKQEIRYTDTFHRSDRPYQVAHLLEKLLVTDKPLEQFDEILDEIEKNPRTLHQIDGIRVEMLSTVETSVRESEDSARKHLLEKVQRAGESCRQKRIQREREEALAAEGRLPKRFRPNEVITIDD